MEFDEVGGWPAVLGTLAARRDLTTEQARAAMAEILDGAATSAQIAGFIVALRMKGETIDELGGLVDAMLTAAERVTLPPDETVVDIVGTGGDRAHTINVSTLSALVVAGAGGRVCKHGNRAASSATGSADLLEALGVRIDCGPEEVARCVAEAGIGFCFAPRFHPAMRHAGPPRRELGIATAFNFLGPLANPAAVRRLMIGVADPSMAERMVGVLAARGSERVMVVHGDDGLDELTISTTSQVVELRDGEMREYPVDPKELGITSAPTESLVGGDPETNAELARRVLAGDAGPHRDIVCLNAGAGLVVAGMADDLGQGLEAARAAIDGGGAAAALDRLVAVSNG
jgi:anthranilate phosphoribosyltransferase